MLSYRVFLTKSHTAAAILQNGLAAKKDNPKLHTGWGCADGASFVPPMYQNKGYFYAAVWYESDKPTYELVIC